MLFYLYATYFIWLGSIVYAEVLLFHIILLFWIICKIIIVESNNSSITSQFFRISDVWFFVILLINFILSVIIGMNYLATNIGGRDIVFFLQILSCFLIVYKNKLEINEVVKFLNITYLIYSILSLFVYLHVFLPALRFDIYNQFDIYVRGYSFKTYVGFDGSTSSIDSYSMLIFVINLLLNKNNKSKYLFMAIALSQSLLTFRMTPIVSILISAPILVFPLKLRKIYTSLCIIFAFISFLIPYQFRNNIDITYSFISYTHYRNITWNNFIEYFRSIDLLNILLGTRTEMEPVYTSWAGKWINHPHSTYLRMLLYYGVINYIIFFIWFFINNLKITNKRFQFVFISTVIFGVTNLNIFYSRTCVYYIILLYLFSIKNNNKKKIKKNELSPTQLEVSHRRYFI